jgi:transposase-like protein
MARRKYSDEYKKEAVAMTELPGATITGVAKDLGEGIPWSGPCP